MKKFIIVLHLLLCLTTLLLLFGCNASPVSASTDEDAESTTYNYDGSLISGLLDKIIASPGTLEPMLVKVTSARLVRQGCLLHYDQIAINDDYVRGSTDPEEQYFINEEVLDEQVAVANAYLNCAKLASPYLDDKFVEYINSKEDGLHFTLYWLDGDVVFLSEMKAS
jgi:hypothetical protein